MTEVRALATDAVILLDGEIVMLERNHEPDAGKWVLPGGFVDPGERAADACVREVREEVGLDVEAISFVGLFDAPDRDERGNVSVAYLCRPTETGQTPEAREEARQVRTFDPRELPDTGFDHGDIIRAATEP